MGNSLCLFFGEAWVLRRISTLDNESWRVGFEAALDLCVSEVEKVRSLGEAAAAISEFRRDVKDDKVERLKEMLAAVHR